LKRIRICLFISIVFIFQLDFSHSLLSVANADDLREPAARKLGGRISEIVVQGNRKIETDAIKARIKSKVGQPVVLKQVHDDVVDLFAMGYFYDIKVDRKIIPSGVRLTYMIVEKPSIVEIKYKGNDELDDDELKEASEIKPYEILDVNTIRLAVEKMQKAYEEKGFFLAKIDHDIEDIKKGESVKLTFNVEENDKVKVKKITIIGNKQLSDTELKSKLATQEEGFFSLISGSGQYKPEAFERDVQIINFLYFNKGFLQVKISRPQIYVTPDKKAIHISIRIDEGEQYSVGDIDFSGDLLFSNDELSESIKIKDETIFVWEVLQKDLSALQAKYGDLGYAYANIVPRTSIRNKERLVDVVFEIDKGNKVYFGTINVVGNSKTRDKVVRRELKIREGELYNETRKRESVANVKRLGFFEDVQFNSKTPPGKPAVMDLDISVKERNTGSIQVGAGYSSQSKFVFNGKVQQTNLFGRGQQLGVDVQHTSNSNRFNINFTEPYFWDTEWTVGFDLYKTQRSLGIDAYDEMKEGGAFRLGHPLAPYLRGYIRYKNDVTKLKLNSQGDEILFPVETANGRTSSATVTVEYDKRDDRFSPSSGIYSSVSFEYAGLGGEKFYTLGTATGRYYRKVFWDVVFRNNLSYAFIASHDKDKAPPFNELFRLGGAYNLRGFYWFSIGEKRIGSDGEEHVFGGKQKLYYNGEFEFPLIKEAGIKGVIFYDIGAATDKLRDDDFRSDIGFGFSLVLAHWAFAI
jgi:outer membrane protein insertion porin family